MILLTGLPSKIYRLRFLFLLKKGISNSPSPVKFHSSKTGPPPGVLPSKTYRKKADELGYFRSRIEKTNSWSLPGFKGKISSETVFQFFSESTGKNASPSISALTSVR